MKTYTLIKELNAYYDIYAELKHDQIYIYNSTLPNVSFVYGFHRNATCTYEPLDIISPSMQGLSLTTLVDMRKLIDKYIATPIENRKPRELYYVKLPSGHYMITFSDGTIGWRNDILLAQTYTEAELKELNELYWTLAIPACQEYMNCTREGTN